MVTQVDWMQIEQFNDWEYALYAETGKGLDGGTVTHLNELNLAEKTGQLVPVRFPSGDVTSLGATPAWAYACGDQTVGAERKELV